METTLPLATLPERNSANRLLLLDILRGFALFGIIINHIAMSFLAGPPPGSPTFNIFSPVDELFNTASFYLTFGKFFTIFSFLFGLSFTIQFDSAQRKETSFNLKFLWRLLLLFGIGFVHNMFYSGDILVIYAILGLVLLPARLLPNKVLLPLALLLILNMPNVVQELSRVNAPAPTQAQIEAQKKSFEGFMKISQEQYRIKQSGTVGEVISMNVIGGLIGKFNFQLMTGRLWITIGLFLLGLYAGKKRFLNTHLPIYSFLKDYLFSQASLPYLLRFLLLYMATLLEGPLHYLVQSEILLFVYIRHRFQAFM